MSGWSSTMMNDHGWVLFGLAVVQVTLVAGGAALVSAWSRHNAAARHATWLTALTLILLGPAWIFAVERLGATWKLPIPSLFASTESSPIEAVAGASSRRSNQDLILLSPNGPETTSPTHQPARSSPRLPISENRATGARGAFGPLGLGTLVLMLWGAGSSLLALRLAWGIASVRRLTRRCQPVTVPWLLDLDQQVRSELRIQSPPRLLLSDELNGPIAAGIFAPVIILPKHLAQPEQSEHLRDVLIHETAHLLRRDPFVGLAQRVASLLWWPHPLVHLVNRGLARAREEVCDNYVLRFGDRHHYSRTLVDLARISDVSPNHLGLLGLLPPRWRLHHRIAGILDERRVVMLHASRGRLLITSCLLFGLTLGLAVLRPAVARVDESSTAREQSATTKKGNTESEQPSPNDKPVTNQEIAGRVVDSDGKPIEGALVQAYSWTPWYKTRTDKNGSFRLTVFNRPGMSPEEGAEMRFGKEGFGPKMFESVKGGTSDLEVILSNTTYFEGVLTKPDGQPVPNTQVRASSPSRRGTTVIGQYWHETKTDANGRYRLFVIPDTFDFQIRVPESGAARIQEQEIAEGQAKTLNIALKPGITFQAKILDSQTKQPVAGLRLSHWQQPWIEGRSNDEGILTIPDMFADVFKFDVRSNGPGILKVGDTHYARWWSEECVSPWLRPGLEEAGQGRYGAWQRNFDGLDFKMSEGMAPVTISLEKAVAIRGRVLDPDGNPVAGATVAPALTGSGNSLTGDSRFSFETKEDGTYEMYLPASKVRTYNLVAHDGKIFTWRKWANGVLPPITTQPGEVLEGIDLHLTRPGIVKGRVLDANGKPVANREVRTAPTDMMENRYYDPTTKTDAEGRFELKYVRPGEQFVQAAPFWLDPTTSPPGTSQTLTVEAGKTVDEVQLVAQGEGGR